MSRFAAQTSIRVCNPCESEGKRRGRCRTLGRLQPFREEHRRARQNHSDFSELAGLRIDFYRPTMLLNDDVVTDGKAKAGPLSSGFRREEGIEHLLFHFRWNTDAVVANPDFHTISKTFGRGGKGWHVFSAVRFRLTLGRCIETV